MIRYVADFETTVEPDKTRVWAYGITEIGNVDNFVHGNNIDDFMKWCRTGENKLVYFHNLKFDGEFILHWLLCHGFTYSTEKESKTFNTIISETGQFYSIEIIFKRMNKRYRKVTFHDSLKKLPFPVEKIAKDFSLPIKKLDIDYKMERPEGYELTQEELEYLKNDVVIVAMALETQLNEGLDRMTNGSDALHTFKEMLGKREFERNFPVLPRKVDNDIRQAYRGGFTYLSDRYKEMDIGRGIVYDVNSLYPSVMYNKPLPYGQPIYFSGQYEKDKIYPLFVQELECTFSLKPGKIPTIQIKHGGRFVQTEYLKSSVDRDGDDIPTTLLLTNMDMQLFFDHYDVTVYSYNGGWKFKSCVGLFKDYIDRFMEIKEREKGAKKLLAKLMLNSLYGKFATNPDVTGKIPYLKENGSVGYKLPRNKDGEVEREFRDPVYTGMGVFITSWARHKTITTAQAVYHRFIYADTDSIHLEGDQEPDIDIHPSKLGAWKHEGTFDKARFIRQKTYVEEIDNVLHVVCAGMPNQVKEKVTWHNFRYGFHGEGKLIPKHVPGGVVLQDDGYSLMRRKGE